MITEAIRVEHLHGRIVVVILRQLRGSGRLGTAWAPLVVGIINALIFNWRFGRSNSEVLNVNRCLIQVGIIFWLDNVLRDKQLGVAMLLPGEMHAEPAFLALVPMWPVNIGHQIIAPIAPFGVPIET